MVGSICEKRFTIVKETKDIILLLDNEFNTIELSNGIIIATWKSPFINLTIAQKSVSSRLAITGEQKYPVLIRIGSTKNSTKEARDFLASEKGCQGLVAAAIYVDSILTNMLATFFIFLNKPKIPTKIFKDESKAMEWLEQFVVKDIKN